MAALARLLPALFALVLMPQAAAADDGADALIAANTRFMGWTLADRSIRTLRTSGTYGKDKLPWQRVSRGALYRDRTTLKYLDAAVEQGFSGRSFWQTDLNGFPVPLENRARERAISESVVLANAVAQLHGTLRSAAGEPAVVRATPDGGAPIDLSFERATGKLVAATIDPDRGSPERIVIDRYAQLDGGRNVLADYHVGSTPVTTDHVEANLPVADDELAPSPARAGWSFVGNPTVAMDRTDRGVIFSATVNGARGRFLLDTGAETSLFTDGFARRAGLKALGHARFETATRPLDAHWARADTIAVGGSVLHDAVVATGLPALGDIDGLIGSDAAAGAIVYVENHAARLGFYDPGAFKAPPGKWTRLTVDLSATIPQVPVTFVGKRDAYLVLDTGNSADTVVSYGLHDVIGDQREFLRYILGAGSIVGGQLRCSWSDGIHVGLLQWQRPVVCFDQSPGETGFLGYGMLSKFDWILDYPEANIFVLAR